MPITIHAIAGNDSENHIPPGPVTSIMAGLVQNHTAQRTLTTMIVSGLFARFPHLKVVSAEFEAGWMPFFMQRLDLRVSQGRAPVELSLKPSEYFRRNVYAAYINDPFAVQNRHSIGVNNLMWSSDYPHGASMWPNSRASVDSYMTDVPADERNKILRENVTRLYGLSVAA